MRGKSLKNVVSRPEFAIIWISWLLTIFAKVSAANNNPNPVFSFSSISLLIGDAVFFSSLLFFVSFLYWRHSSKSAATCIFLFVFLVFGWSAANAAMLLSEGTQLQPNMVKTAILDFHDLWPIVRNHFNLDFTKLTFLGGSGLTVLAGVIFTSFKIRLEKATRPMYSVHAMLWAIVLISAVACRVVFSNSVQLSPSTEMLKFSSHYYALKYFCCMGNTKSERKSASQNVRHAGNVTLSQFPNASNLPNIILVVLETCPYSRTTMSDSALETTPFLASLARQGTEFTRTYAPVASTTKALWTILTSTAPVIENDYREAIPVEGGYEALPWILKQAGYRSAVFEMSKGSYQCAPGLFKNMGYDWAWFRENLCDDSAYLGYMCGDDMKVLDPAVNWINKSEGPYFLTIVTTVSHDPYCLPKQLGPDAGSPEYKYIQTLKYTDRFVEKLFYKISEDPAKQNTIFCVIGDHGTSFRTQACKGRWIPNEEVIRVPWFIFWKGNIKPGLKVNAICSQLDVMPTILGLFDFKVVGKAFDGIDALSNADDSRRLYFWSGFPGTPFGFVEGFRKIAYWPATRMIFEYDLRSDPNESNPAVITGPDKEEILNELAIWRNKTKIILSPAHSGDQLLFEHWRVISTDSSAWAYYVK